MKKNLILLAIALTVILMMTGCRTAPVYNVHDASIPTEDNAPLSMDEIAKAIIKAGNGLGWQMQPVKPGLIVGTLNIRSHQAVVNISYDQTDYNIDYKNSYNLKYDGTKIHSNYNGWVMNLSKAINNNLASAQYK